jgi:hypothetical protein
MLLTRTWQKLSDRGFIISRSHPSTSRSRNHPGRSDWKNNYGLSMMALNKAMPLHCRMQLRWMQMSYKPNGEYDPSN